MNHLDLFSGIGGFSLAAEVAGFTTVAFCEYDKKCQEGLLRNFPGVPIHKDIKALKGEHIEQQITLLTGGYPCQPFSVAGNQKAFEDDRDLWPEMFRVIKEVRPTWVVGENVNGHVTLGLDRTLLDLEIGGYATSTFVIPACAVAAKHRRDRVIIVGHAQFDGSFAAPVTRGRDENSQRTKEGQGASIKSKRTSGRGNNETVAHASSEGLQREEGQSSASTQGQSSGHIAQRSGTVPNTVSQRGRSRDAERQDAEDAGQSPGSAKRRGGGTAPRRVKPRLGGGTHGVSAWLDGSWEDGIPRVSTRSDGRKQRTQQLGNAIVPQVFIPLFLAIAELEIGVPFP